MNDFLDKIKKGVEEGYGVVRSNANILKDRAEDLSKIAKLKFELHQLRAARERKLTLLGQTIFPYLLESNLEGLKTHETLQILLDEIKNLNNQIELVQHAIADISVKDTLEHKKVQNSEKIRKEIEKLEQEIENHLQDIKAVKKTLDK
ncbi:MAG: hypothetical protein H6627_12535 [Calditrichae bacterium]|nr:hypothetical protein [Calditrichota bacterium]MCB9059390.1 hypothetical protein [Calditrichia bacterium]